VERLEFGDSRATLMRVNENFLERALMAFAEQVQTALERRDQRLDALESAGSLCGYAGTWKQGETYAADALITAQGSLWLARQETSDKPPSAAWRLIVRGGAR
jgi:hypothetical protein